MTEYAIIVACTPNGGIGKDNKIPWFIKEDLRYFQKTTLTTNNSSKINAIIMGKKTWESLPIKPLSGRLNVIISTSLKQDDIQGVLIARSLEHAHSILKQYSFIDKIFVIGGARLYRDAVFDYHYTKLYLTNIYKEYDCDTFIDLKLFKERYKIIKEGKIQISNNIDNNEYSHDEYEQVYDR